MGSSPDIAVSSNRRWAKELGFGKGIIEPHIITSNFLKNYQATKFSVVFSYDAG